MRRRPDPSRQGLVGNNFAFLSRELPKDLRETLRRLHEDLKADTDDLMGMIGPNLERIAGHGRRADPIVKSTLAPSRQGPGKRARVNMNAMVEEALNLGYHGALAEKPGSDANPEKDFAPDAGVADLDLQDVKRVLPKLISNAISANARRRLHEGPDCAPTLKASMRDPRHSIAIRIRETGSEIPDKARANMFNLFFTTKPAGLGHDIAVKQHGRTVETAPGACTEFVIVLGAGVGA